MTLVCICAIILALHFVSPRYNRTVPLGYHDTLLKADHLACPKSESTIFQRSTTSDSLVIPRQDQLNSSHFFAEDPEILKDDSLSTMQASLSLGMPGFDIEVIWSNVDWSTLRIVFICMDILLLFYRMCHLYLTITKFCYGFEDATELSSSEVKRAQEVMQKDTTEEHAFSMTPDWVDTTQTSLATDSDHGLHPGNHMDKNVILPRAKTKQKANGDINKADYQSIADVDNKQHGSESTQDQNQTFITRRTVIRRSVKRLVDSDFVPKVVLGSAIVTFACAVLQVTEYYFELDMFLVFSGLSPLLLNLDKHLLNANQFLETMAQQASSSMTAWFPNHTNDELQEVQWLMEFFTKGDFTAAIQFKHFCNRY